MRRTSKGLRLNLNCCVPSLVFRVYLNLSMPTCGILNHVTVHELDFLSCRATFNFGRRRPRSSHLPSATPIDHLIMLSSRTIFRATRAAASQRIAVPRAIASSQIRSYATPAAADSKPPKALYGLDGTYASALVRYLNIKYSQSRWTMHPVSGRGRCWTSTNG
jgi:hypothetical protein